MCWARKPRFSPEPLILLLDPKPPILWSPQGIWMELEGPHDEKAPPPRKPQPKAVREPVTESHPRAHMEINSTFIREPGGVPRRCSQDVYAKGEPFLTGSG